MILFQDAYQIVMKQVNPITQTEQVTLKDAPGRILAVDVLSDRELPPFNRVAMDGYACKRADLDKELEIVEIVPAGHQPQKIINTGQCAKVMTGCPLPDGADMVFMVEYSEEFPENKIHFSGNEKQAKPNNYAPQGEDVEQGEIVLSKGTLISPKHIGVLASVGCAEPKVMVRPKVGIIATGDEIVEPSQIPESHQIRNSNSYQLMTQVERAGAVPKYYGIAIDTFDAISESLNKAADECDVILLSGGVSMGDFDLVPDVMKKNNFEILFNKVAVKPGKPTTLAVSSNAVCFGMPGNPVSTFIIFEILVKPFLYELMGHPFNPLTIKLPLAENITRKKTGRDSWTPIRINDNGEIESLKYHGSGHFHALTFSDGIIKFPKGENELKKGTLLNVRQI